jgi:hypothetical protein
LPVEANACTSVVCSSITAVFNREPEQSLIKGIMACSSESGEIHAYHHFLPELELQKLILEAAQNQNLYNH